MSEAWRIFDEDLAWGRDVMAAASVGLWTISYDTRTEKTALFVSEGMRNLLGMPEGLDPEECAAFWLCHVESRDVPLVRKSLVEFKDNAAMREIRYTYCHPTLGPMHVRCGGRRGVLPLIWAGRRR